MPNMTCNGCYEDFHYDTNDIRPYIYHQCPDGTYYGHKNPNLEKKNRSYISYTKTKKTRWQSFEEF